MRDKKILGYLLGAAVLFSLCFPAMRAAAVEDSFIVWAQGSKDNRVNVSVSLSQKEQLDDITSLKVRFYLDGTDVRDASFVFDSAIKGNKEITVKEAKYNSDNQTLTVYLSGRDVFLKKGTVKKLGYIEVDAGSDVEITVAEDSADIVDFSNDQSQVLELGANRSYKMNLEREKPKEEKPKEEKPSARPDAGTRTSSEDDRGSSQSVNWSHTGADWKFKKPDGSYAANEWVLADGKWYWFGTDGNMKTGWQGLNGNWYYCGPSGDMKTGWVQDNNKWYYCERSGAMKTGWIENKSRWYYLNQDGAMKTGWIQYQDKWYYMAEDGSMLANEMTPDGYRVDRNGVFVK